MDTEQQGTPETYLTATDVAKGVKVPVRQVLYLRERGVVLPSIAPAGRGKYARYTAQDTVRVFLALRVLGFLEYSLRARMVEKILSYLPQRAVTAWISVSPGVSLRVDLKAVRHLVSELPTCRERT
jgi:hypothetical protein